MKKRLIIHNNIARSKNIFSKNNNFGLKKHHTFRRILNLALNRFQLFLRLPKIIGYPTYLVFETTNICNLRCPLCPTGQGLEGRLKGKLSFANFKKIIDEMGVYLYSLRLENWGEPLLNDELFDMITYAKSRRINVSFNTNFTLFNEERARRMILSGLDSVKISLDGATEDSYAKYRVGGDFSKVVENIKLLTGIRDKLKKKNPFIEIQFIVMKHNENEIMQMQKLCSELKVDGLFIERLRPGMREELFDSSGRSIEKFKDWLPADSRHSIFNYGTKSRKFSPKICYYLWTSIIVNWDGIVTPCCSIYDECHNFGNIFIDGFRKIWNNPKYISSRKLMGRRIKDDEATVCMNCFKNGVIT